MSHENLHIWGVDELRMKMDEPTDPQNFARNRAIKMMRAKETYDKVGSLNDRLGAPPVYQQEGELGFTLTFDRQFQHGAGQIVVDMFRDLQALDQGDIAYFILQEGVEHKIP